LHDFSVTCYLEKNENISPRSIAHCLPKIYSSLSFVFVVMFMAFLCWGCLKKLLKVVNFDIFSRILLRAFNPTHRLLLAQHFELAPSFCPIFMLVIVVVSNWNRWLKLILIFLLRILLDALSPTHSPLLPYNLEPSLHLFQSPYLFMALLLDVFEQGG